MSLRNVGRGPSVDEKPMGVCGQERCWFSPAGCAGGRPPPKGSRANGVPQALPARAGGTSTPSGTHGAAGGRAAGLLQPGLS